MFDKEDFAVLAQTEIFRGIGRGEIAALTGDLRLEPVLYGRDERILASGQQVDALFILLSGEAVVVRDDFWGRRSVLAHIGTGGVFAESYALSGGAPLTVDVFAKSRARVLAINVSACMDYADPGVAYKLTRNFLRVLAAKNLYLNSTVNHLTRRTTREKLLSYLSAQAEAAGTDTFEIPFNRQQLAEYLSVDRSALSTELGKMKREGMIDFDRNSFTLRRNDVRLNPSAESDCN